MYPASPKRKGGATVVRLVESYRKDGKVKTRTVKTIGQSKDPKTIKRYQQIARQLAAEHKQGLSSLPALPVKLPIDLIDFMGKERINTGFEDIFGAVWRQLGFDSLIKTGRDSEALNQHLRSLVLARLFSPSSKLRSCRLLEEHFSKTLSHRQALYLMDHLSKNEEETKAEMSRSVLKDRSCLDLLLFDVTTLHFESVNQTDLQDFGYSKDGKFNEVQVVLAVLADQEGLPVSYEVFPGNTGESETLRGVLASAAKRHKARRIRVVADKGLFSNKNLSFLEDLKRERGVEAEYVVSYPLRKLPLEWKERVWDRGNYKPKAGGSFYEFEYKGRRVAVGFNEARRACDEAKRRRILDKLRAMEKDGEIPSSALVRNSGDRKYTEKVLGKTRISWKKAERDARFDGLYGVCSNIKKEPPEKLLEMYRSLWKIEELFRINKHSLRMRPIYHRKPERIRAHLMICFLAYTVLRRTELTLKKQSLFFSPEELSDILKRAESFIISDKIKKPGAVYCVPRALSREAEQIYAVFGKKYPKQPYRLD